MQEGKFLGGKVITVMLEEAEAPGLLWDAGVQSSDKGADT